jgi:hypothetical protein
MQRNGMRAAGELHKADELASNETPSQNVGDFKNEKTHRV